MNTIENNKLIAEFMGIPSYEYRGYTMFEFEEDNHRTDIDLHYHESWNWLMPVVEKITQQTKEFKEGHVDSCLYTPLASALIRFTDKELVYEAVVEFIEWYNQNK